MPPLLSFAKETMVLAMAHPALGGIILPLRLFKATTNVVPRTMDLSTFGKGAEYASFLLIVDDCTAAANVGTNSSTSNDMDIPITLSIRINAAELNFWELEVIKRPSMGGSEVYDAFPSANLLSTIPNMVW
mmetsp:Transcript_8161/g.13980  ORF Transcript_8161/g.13980 Transcript_8161/m.13980 type:complete len:131 (-) Transcript_8161:74-466(-)